MKRQCARAATAASILCFALAVSAGDAAAQAAKRLVGTWTLVSEMNTDASGKKQSTFGADPKGQVIFTSNGRYVLLISRADLPKFAANSRAKGTAEENKAVVGGSISHFGKYSVDEKDKSFTFHIESATYPNWSGTTQQRAYSVKGDELKWNTAASSGGGSSDLVWKRVK